MKMIRHNHKLVQGEAALPPVFVEKVKQQERHALRLQQILPVHRDRRHEESSQFLSRPNHPQLRRLKPPYSSALVAGLEALLPALKCGASTGIPTHFCTSLKPSRQPLLLVEAPRPNSPTRGSPSRTYAVLALVFWTLSLVEAPHPNSLARGSSPHEPSRLWNPLARVLLLVEAPDFSRGKRAFRPAETRAPAPVALATASSGIAARTPKHANNPIARTRC
jgi:hypothetical protein